MKPALVFIILKNIRIILAICVLYLINARPVYAYTDPGSGLLILQILGSVFVGALFYFSKIKNWIKNKFKNDK